MQSLRAEPKPPDLRSDQTNRLFFFEFLQPYLLISIELNIMHYVRETSITSEFTIGIRTLSCPLIKEPALRIDQSILFYQLLD